MTKLGVLAFVVLGACGGKAAAPPPEAARAPDWSAIAGAGLGGGEVSLTPLGRTGLVAPLPSGAEVTDVSDDVGVGFPLVLVGPAEVAYQPLASLYVSTTGTNSDVLATLAETRAFRQASHETFIAFTHEATTADGWVLRWQTRHDTGEIREHLLVRRTFAGAIWDCELNSLVASTIAGGQAVCEGLQPAPVGR